MLIDLNEESFEGEELDVVPYTEEPAYYNSQTGADDEQDDEDDDEGDEQEPQRGDAGEDPPAQGRPGGRVPTHPQGGLLGREVTAHGTRP